MRATEYVAAGIFDENFLASRREVQGRGYRGRGFIPSITGIGIDGGREIYVLTVLLERKEEEETDDRALENSRNF